MKEPNKLDSTRTNQNNLHLKPQSQQNQKANTMKQNLTRTTPTPNQRTRVLAVTITECKSQKIQKNLNKQNQSEQYPVWPKQKRTSIPIEPTQKNLLIHNPNRIKQHIKHSLAPQKWSECKQDHNRTKHNNPNRQRTKNKQKKNWTNSKNQTSSESESQQNQKYLKTLDSTRTNQKDLNLKPQ